MLDRNRYSPVEVCIGWPINIQISPADIIDGLIVHHEGTVRVLQGCVRSQDRVVGFHNSCCYLDRS